MKKVILAIGLLFGSLAHAGPCFRGDVNGNEIGGLMNTMYALHLTLPDRDGSGKMTVVQGSTEIASTPVYRESDREFGFENYTGLFDVERLGNTLLIKVNGGILNVNGAGELHLKRQKGQSHVYALQPTKSCR